MNNIDIIIIMVCIITIVTLLLCLRNSTKERDKIQIQKDELNVFANEMLGEARKKCSEIVKLKVENDELLKDRSERYRYEVKLKKGKYSVILCADNKYRVLKMGLDKDEDAIGAIGVGSYLDVALQNAFPKIKE